MFSERASRDAPDMPSSARRPALRHARHSAVLAIAVLVAVAALGSRPGSAAAADLTVPAAEQALVGLLNAERQKAGLVALRVDPRLTSIAHARSADMAAKGYFSHTQPDGRTVANYLAADKITWYAYGEIIALNSSPNLADSAAQARNGWMGSPPHRSIVLSKSYNYFGIGLALNPATGKRLWTGVFIKGPDRTGGWVAFGPVIEPAPVAAAVNRTVTITWRGGDIQLVVLTAGLLHYQTQVSTDDGPWVWFSTATTATSRNLRVWQGHGYTFRARACDRAANCGYWSNLALEG
jgi:uncharacterized protein YkwD